LKDRDTSVFFDFGMSIGMKKRYYSMPFISPRSERSLLAFGLLPSIGGIYKFDQKERSVDAVFLSHSHTDHAAYISFLKQDIPVYCGETTATILRALDSTRGGRFEFDLNGRSFKTFRTGNNIRIGDIEVEPIHVDHSVPGAYGFLIHTSAGSIVYTGDLRLHGERPQMSEEFIEASRNAHPVAIVTEGTNMTGAAISSEAEVGDKICTVVQGTSGIVLADFAGGDIDRLRSFHDMSRKCGRSLAITMRQAYLLSKLKGDPHLRLPEFADDRMLVFRKEKKRYYHWEKEVMDRENVVDSTRIAAMQRKVVLVCSFYDFEELVDIKPVPQSCYILSSSEPYDEEMELDFERLVNWLVYYGLPQYNIHVSGHIMPLQLLDMLKRIGARCVFPIHCQYPDLFARFVGGTGGEVKRIELGREYPL
jgi:ribonuclease J